VRDEHKSNELAKDVLTFSAALVWVGSINDIELTAHVSPQEE
jgi:hypothetical protein